MSPRRKPLFLGKSSYRQRRLRDAAQLMPVCGLTLWLIPLLWPHGDGGQPTSSAVLYVFAVWAGLIVAAFLLSRSLSHDEDATADEGSN